MDIEYHELESVVEPFWSYDPLLCVCNCLVIVLCWDAWCLWVVCRALHLKNVREATAFQNTQLAKFNKELFIKAQMVFDLRTILFANRVLGRLPWPRPAILYVPPWKYSITVEYAPRRGCWFSILCTAPFQHLLDALAIAGGVKGGVFVEEIPYFWFNRIKPNPQHSMYTVCGFGTNAGSVIASIFFVFKRCPGRLLEENDPARSATFPNFAKHLMRLNTQTTRRSSRRPHQHTHKHPTAICTTTETRKPKPGRVSRVTSRVTSRVNGRANSRVKPVKHLTARKLKKVKNLKNERTRKKNAKTSKTKKATEIK